MTPRPLRPARPSPRARHLPASTSHRAAWLFTVCSLGGALVGQSNPPRPLADDPATLEQRRWRETRDLLAQRDPDGFLAPAGKRLKLLVNFLDGLGPLPDGPAAFGPREAVRCEAWNRLAALHLARRDGEGARHAFRKVLELSGPAQLDLRGRARFGIAQSHEAEGAEDTARALFEAIETAPEFTGTRYSDWARSALARLEHGCAVGDLAPDYGPRRDLTDQVHTLNTQQGKPVLLLFASAEDPAGLQRIGTVLAAARAAGLAADRMPLLLTDAFAKDRAATLASTFGWSQPVLPSRSAFIDRSLLDYRITTLPAWVLIGPDGRLLGRDIPPHRLAGVLKGLGTR